MHKGKDDIESHQYSPVAFANRHLGAIDGRWERKGIEGGGRRCHGTGL
jgi:hypothetical protein